MPVGSAEVLVLGAGVSGCALAYHLTQRGVGPVVVYDPATPAAGATGRAAGVVTEQLWDRWDVEVTRESHREYARLCQRWEPEAYLPNGFVRWTKDPTIASLLEQARVRLRGWGVDVEEASAADLARWLPEGRFDDVVGALYSPHDACVTPSSLATIYAEGARQAGAIFDFGRPFARVLRDGGLWRVDAEGSTLTARRLVVAAGAWSKRILREAGHPQPLVPYRTQAAVLRPPRPRTEPFPTVHDLDTDVYVRPEGPGRLLGGDGTERVEADPERFAAGGDIAFLEHLAETLSSRLPGWSEASVVASWAGVCTATPDRRPLVGEVPGAPGLFLMAGFNGFGVMRAGAVARRLADLLADGPDSPGARDALAPVAPARFSAEVPPFLPRPGFTLEAGLDPRV